MSKNFCFALMIQKSIFINFSALLHRLNKSSTIAASMSHIESSYTHGSSSGKSQPQSLRHKRSTVSVHDERSIKSLDFESDSGQTINTNYDDYASEPVPAPKIRPTPPKKPLRLSLQRATSLQVVNIQADNRHHQFAPSSPLADIANSTPTAADKKRMMRRIHKDDHQKLSLLNDKFSNLHSRSIDLSSRLIEHNLSNSRQKYV